jgi:hypothetical protein
VCYLETTQGKVLDLTRLCQLSSPPLAPSLLPPAQFLDSHWLDLKTRLLQPPPQSAPQK